MIKKEYLILIIILLILTGIYLITNIDRGKKDIKQICFEDNCFDVITASTNYEKEKGLMDYESLEDNKGMLFLFEKEDKQSFWMKNMSFPIDIIWIDKNLEIVGFVENAQPCIEECKIYYSEESSLYVLEINAGKIEEFGISSENKVTLNYQ